MTDSVSDAAVDARRRNAGRDVPVDEDEDEKDGVREWWTSIFCDRLCGWNSRSPLFWWMRWMWTVLERQGEER